MKSLKLNLKGENPLKKKSKRKHQEPKPNNEDDVNWKNIRSIDDLNGPIVILSLVTASPSALKASHQKAPCFQLIRKDLDPEWAPDDVDFVFIPLKISGNKFALRTPTGRYLGVDSIGGVICEKEAIGNMEGLELVSRENGFALQTFKGFLSCSTSGEVRGDSDSIGSREVFIIKTQARFLSCSKDKSSGTSLESDNLLENEASIIKKYHRHNDINNISTERLKKARKEGNFHELLLNYRIKSKSDKFCK